MWVIGLSVRLSVRQWAKHVYKASKTVFVMVHLIFSSRSRSNPAVKVKVTLIMWGQRSKWTLAFICGAILKEISPRILPHQYFWPSTTHDYREDEVKISKNTQFCNLIFKEILTAFPLLFYVWLTRFYSVVLHIPVFSPRKDEKYGGRFDFTSRWCGMEDSNIYIHPRK